MRLIELTRGKVAMVDDADYFALSKFKWHAANNGSVRNPHWYAVHSLTSTKKVMMHALLAGKGADHADGDGLNNTRANLRPATAKQQSHNTRPRAGEFKGVTRRLLKSGKVRWYAQIQVDGLKIHLGASDSAAGAARLYDRAAWAHFGEYARLNSPDALLES